MLYVVAGLALLGLTLYFSTLSFALRAYSRSRLSEQLKQELQRAWLDWLDKYERDLQALTSFARVGVNFAVLLWLCWGYSLEFNTPINGEALLWSTLWAWVLLAFFAIGIPEAITHHAGECVLARSFRILHVIRLLGFPVTRLLHGIDFVTRRLMGKTQTAEEEESERVELEILDAVSEGEAHGTVDEAQKEMIQSVFALHETTVSATMTPRTDIDAIQVDASYDEVRSFITKVGHSRIPVYEDTLDHIIGVLYAKDLLARNPEDSFSVREMMRSVPYVPETMTIDHLLRELRQRRVHIAIVLDEYGGTAGLVTIEDILEEVVGEIDDEYDSGGPLEIQEIDADTIEVDARTHVSEINEHLRVALPEDEDYDTIGGFVFTTLGKIPEPGEEFTHQNLHIKILDAETRKINRLRIHVVRDVESA